LYIMDKVIKKAKEFLGIIGFSFRVSWITSRKYLMVRLFIEVLIAGIPFGIIILNKILIDYLVNLPDIKVDSINGRNYFISIIFLMFVLNVMYGLLGKIKDYCGSMHKELIGKEIEIQIAEQSASLDLSYFDSAKFYNEMNNAKKDSYALETLTWILMDMIRSGIQFIISFAAICKHSPIFAFIIIIAGIPSVFSEKRFVEVIYRWQKNHTPKERKMNYIMSIFTGRVFAKDVRLYDIQKYLLEKYNSMWDGWFKDKRSTTFKSSIYVMLLSTLPEIGAMVISLFIGIDIINGRLTIGDYSLYTGLVGQLTSGLFMIITLTSKMHDNNLRLVNYNNFMKWESIIKQKGSEIVTNPMNIHFDDVSFKYPGTEQYILKNVSFSIYKNEKVAIVGSNGAGKSTIVKLLLRFYDPSGGKILVNGKDIKEYKLKEYRKHFSVMFQDYVGYAFTIRENITISDLNGKDDMAKAKNAAEKSGVNSIIDKCSSGLETYLTRQFEEDGRELSGGEWQKIALARTFFSDGTVIILDEPSAALDPEAEHQIFETFTELCKDKGAIFISHRLSNVTMADRIIVLDNGQIIEDGSHEELMKLKGRYAYLFSLQAERYKVG